MITEHYTKCNDYLGKRTGTYDFRCRRYKAVADIMEKQGLSDFNVIVDVGAGRGEFGRYLRERFPDHGLVYVPFDGSIDGVDLEHWLPTLRADYYVAIEFLEHMRYPWRLVSDMRAMAYKSVIITTPNPAVVDVLAMDETHKLAITEADLQAHNFIHIEALPLFTDTPDTLVAMARGRG